MERHKFVSAACLCVASAVSAGFHARVGGSTTGSPAEDGAIANEVAEIARIEMQTFEVTKRARNERLSELFHRQVEQQGGKVTDEAVQKFHALLKQNGLTTFEDFWATEAAPLRYRKDPASGDDVPVLGPLGSDVICTWLSAARVVPGKPLDEQPIYRLAAVVLREHVDFTLIGIRDPSLSLESLPAKLRENATLAYARLNPANRFDGGFDHPLFYITVREAARKLFREDYPQLRMTMAEVVQPESAGGFGVRSCMLCHEQSHAGVYRRLLAQGLYLQATAGDFGQDAPEPHEGNRSADTLLRAAEIVSKSASEKIDETAVRQSLATMAPENVARLRPGYANFYMTLAKQGCLQCHTKGADVPEEKDPSAYGAFTLEASEYFQTRNIRSLLSVIKPQTLDKSKLLMKASAKVSHEGEDTVKLDESSIAELRQGLEKWLYLLDN